MRMLCAVVLYTHAPKRGWGYIKDTLTVNCNTKEGYVGEKIIVLLWICEIHTKSMQIIFLILLRGECLKHDQSNSSLTITQPFHIHEEVRQRWWKFSICAIRTKG